MNAQQERLPVLIADIEARAPAFAKMLPPSVRPERFLNAAKTALLTVPDLVNCDRQSIVLCCLRCAQDGLVPDGRDAVFVVGNSKRNGQWVKVAQYWTMVGGLMKIAFRSGHVLKLESRVVHERDAFQIIYGTQPGIEHRPAMVDKGEILGAYAVATLRGGHTYVEWMDRDEIDGIMRRSKSTKDGQPTGPWKSDYAEMARKTVLRRALKYLPSEALPKSDDDEPVELAAPEAELALGRLAFPSVEYGVSSGRAERAADRPAEEPEDAQEVAEAEMLAEPPETPAEPPSRRQNGQHQGRLEELQRALADAKDAEAVENAFMAWDFPGDPVELTAQAKELVDNRLQAIKYARAQGK